VSELLLGRIPEPRSFSSTLRIGTTTGPSTV
jgi:hypothetical protein